MGKPKRKLTKYNKCMSVQLKGKMAGKTKAQRAAMFKQAARYCSGKTSKKPSTVSKPKSRASPSRRNPTGGTRRMTTFNMSKIYKWVRIGGVLLPAATTIFKPGLSAAQKGKQLSLDYFGFNPDDGSFKWERLSRGWLPGIAATVITIGVSKIGSLIRSILK